MAKLAMGELEAAVKDVLWDGGTSMTPGEVHDVLVRERPIAYTTVMTILVRLWQKGQLKRERRGRAYAYHPVQTREQQAATEMSRVLAAAGNRSTALAQFLEALSERERSQLRRLLGARRRR